MTKVPTAATMVKATVTTATGDTLKSFLSAKSPVGAQVKITGVSLTETTGVKFGAVASTEFEVVSDKEVTVTVPTGATTGAIEITTSGGTATSKKNFTVTK